MHELTSLRYFLGILDCGGFTAASRTLNVTQPALTRSLKNLEFQLDCVLIKRDTGQLELTPEGEMLAQRTRLLMAEYKSMIEDVRRTGKNSSLEVLVRGAPLTAVSLLPEVLRRLREENPEIQVSLVGIDASYEDQRRAIAAGDIDVALTIYDPINEAAGLVQEVMIEPEAKLLVRRGHEALSSPHDLARLAQYTWIAPPGRLGRSLMEAEFRLENLELPASVIQIGDWRMAIDMLETTDHIMLIPYHETLRSYFNNRFEVLPNVLSVRPLRLAIVSRPMQKRRTATQAFIEMVRTVARAQNAIS